MTTKHQIAVNLDGDAFDRLKRLASASGQPYGVVIAHALNALEAGASSPLATTSRVAYGELHAVERRAWRRKVRAWRESGISYNGIAKKLFQEHGLTAADGLPLGASTIHGMAAL